MLYKQRKEKLKYRSGGNNCEEALFLNLSVPQKKYIIFQYNYNWGGV